MQKNRVLRKEVVVGVILLFFGVAFAPSINVSIVKASAEDDFVEVTTQTCGIKGYGNTIVKLTREQYENLEQYLVDFRERLNQTTTRNEKVTLYKEAVVEFDEYGLLPRGLSIENAQKMITGKLSGKSDNRLYSASSRLKFLKYNFFCLVSGNVIEAPFMNLPVWFIIGILSTIAFKTDFLLLLGPCLVLGFADLYLCNGFRNSISLSQSMNTFNTAEHLCSGWIDTYGLLGTRRYEGNLSGLFLKSFGEIGMVDFTGLKIHTGASVYDYYFIGSALAVGMDSDYLFF